jgi:hypothetical protein
LVDGFFDSIDQDGFPIGMSGLVSGAIDPSVFTNALDGEVILKILLNSTTVNLSDGSITIDFNNPNGEPAAFDYFKLTISGTLATIPVPAAVWLFCSGLLGLIGIARRKSTA